MNCREVGSSFYFSFSFKQKWSKVEQVLQVLQPSQVLVESDLDDSEVSEEEYLLNLEEVFP